MGKKAEKKGVELMNGFKFVMMHPKEMEGLIKGLPDWAFDGRRKLAKKYRGYKYAVDGKRVDGLGRILKSDGEFQWLLYYLFYRECGKGKRTRYCSKLVAAYCINRTGRYGIWVSDEFEVVEVKYLPLHSKIQIPVEKSDILEAFKYINIENWEFNDIRLNFENQSQYWRDGEGKMIFPAREINQVFESFHKPLELYLRYPQTEFIFKLQNRELASWMQSQLISIMTDENPDLEYLKELIAVYRLCLKHKNQIFNDCKPNELSIWSDYILDLWQKKKDIRNPHYFNESYQNIWRKHIIDLRDLWKNREEERLVLQAKKDYNCFMRLKKRFIGLKMEDEDGLEVMTLNSPEEYILESKAMHNCIANSRYYIRENSLILVARKKGKRVADIELDLNSWKILQCFGPCNRYIPKVKKQIEKLIKANLDEIKRRYFRA